MFQAGRKQWKWLILSSILSYVCHLLRRLRRLGLMLMVVLLLVMVVVVVVVVLLMMMMLMMLLLLLPVSASRECGKTFLLDKRRLHGIEHFE